MIRFMVKVSTLGLTDVDSKDIGLMLENADKESNFTLMAIITMENGKMTCKMGMVYTYGLMDVDIMVSGKMAT